MSPRRSNNYQICLKEGALPVNMRSYRYPFYQNTEIEKIVQELLKVVVVRNNQSPFFSLVLLVRKYEGSWQMCIDCKALNKEVIKDKFPFSIIDELLYKFFGAIIFSKLDLRSGYH